MTKRIYVLAPESTWGSDRYETLMFLIFHKFATSTIIEQRDTPEPKDASLLIFIRDEDHVVDLDMWTRLTLAQKSGQTVRLARMDRTGQLVLVPWSELEFAVQEYGVQVSYASTRKKVATATA